MKSQKSLKFLGYGLLIFSIAYMVYKFITDKTGDTTYIVYGLFLSAIGSFLAQSNRKGKDSD